RQGAEANSTARRGMRFAPNGTPESRGTGGHARRIIHRAISDHRTQTEGAQQTAIERIMRERPGACKTQPEKRKSGKPKAESPTSMTRFSAFLPVHLPKGILPIIRNRQSRSVSFRVRADGCGKRLTDSVSEGTLGSRAGCLQCPSRWLRNVV